jgi:hypothetical protein
MLRVGTMATRSKQRQLEGMRRLLCCCSRKGLMLMLRVGPMAMRLKQRQFKGMKRLLCCCLRKGLVGPALKVALDRGHKTIVVLLLKKGAGRKFTSHRLWVWWFAPGSGRYQPAILPTPRVGQLPTWYKPLHRSNFGKASSSVPLFLV